MTVPPLPHDHFAICESEPITTPGAIQPFGALLAFDPETRAVAYASANAQDFFGAPAEALLGASVETAFAPDSVRRILDLMRSERYAPTNFTAVVCADGSRGFDAVVHRAGALAVVECLPGGEALEAASAISDAQRLIQRIRAAPDLDTMLAIAVEEARALTGFDRAMVYRFDDDDHGEVVAESREPGLEPFLGLHYPASDIPSQARRMYLLQRVRQIPDVRTEPVDLLGRDARGRDARGLDLTYAVLRGVSPYHIEYLANMGVAATLAVSIIVEDRLWGMLVFHHQSPRLVDCTMRGLMDLVGQTLSVMVDIRAAADRKAVLAARSAAVAAVEEELSEADSVGSALSGVSDKLVEALCASGCYVRIGGAHLAFGETPPEPVCRQILARLSQGETSYGSTHEIGALDPAFARWQGSAAGAAAIFLPNNPGDGVVWFRPERRRAVAWGGDPNHPVHVDQVTGRLGPRRSFAKWVEIVEGTAERWTPADGEIAQRLRRALIAALLRISEERLDWIKNFDPLTGLLRREIAETRLRRTVAAVESGVVGVLVVAVSRYSAIVERYGARMGDQLLVAASRRLQALARRGEYIARHGEDAFMMVARRDAVDDLRRLGAEILDAFRQPLLEDGAGLLVGVRVGVAAHPGCPVDLLVSTAAAAEREAAKDKRGRWVLFERPPERRQPTQADYELEIAAGLARNEFRAVFQPIVALADGRPLGMEALCRWRSRAFGDVSPAQFVPAAVEAGQIFALTTLMLDLALRTAARHLLSRRIAYVSVNVDVSLLERRSFSAVALSALHRNGLPPSALVLEVTESALGSDAAIGALAELRSRGVRIAVDDFGVGYSSLAYLNRMPVDVVKIDRGFVAGAVEDARGAALFSSIAGLIRSLGFESVVEGVETQAQREAALAEGCAAAQGYLFAKPLETDELDAYLASSGGA